MFFSVVAVIPLIGFPPLALRLSGLQWGRHQVRD
jgi:hypothetical protein